jgi:hypothetical protein
MMDTASLASRQGAIASSLTEETIKVWPHSAKRVSRPVHALPSPKGAIPLRTNFWPGWQASLTPGDSTLSVRVGALNMMDTASLASRQGAIASSSQC